MWKYRKRQMGKWPYTTRRKFVNFSQNLFNFSFACHLLFSALKGKRAAYTSVSQPKLVARKKNTIGWLIVLKIGSSAATQIELVRFKCSFRLTCWEPLVYASFFSLIVKHFFFCSSKHFLIAHFKSHIRTVVCCVF